MCGERPRDLPPGQLIDRWLPLAAHRDPTRRSRRIVPAGGEGDRHRHEQCTYDDDCTKPTNGFVGGGELALGEIREVNDLAPGVLADVLGPAPFDEVLWLDVRQG